ncbi:hypothetical protein [Silvibacterium dinghuense]|uniref:Outer membrane protein beta-barrel domain-containing protein n=1 Tax=Silvibacterium dinghuense TaxID=1560006 RepID=A0A4Q1S8S1_9BACT|nr:hypothetical protein [Silvibacterium dinghuense]RXS93397.1 hypothetical protein ESZ00_18795 [Silvibacterium dinghuense]GGH05477.1 hypothetical protein GCM10011586_22040 [Silvibacterium dinghuense]
MTEGKKKIFWVLAVVFAALLGGAVPARAQYQQPILAPNDTLANVHYDYKWEFYGGIGYSHFNAGPELVQGSNLGGFDVQAARFFTRRWAVAANGRGYYGTSGVEPNTYGIKGPFVSEHMFLVGPEYRGPSNEHVSMTFHALVGGAYGRFNSATQDQSGQEINPELIGLFNNQTTFASAIGGSIDLNRSPKWVFRISPDATLTHFKNSAGEGNLHEQFALSVGVVYRWRRGLK